MDFYDIIAQAFGILGTVSYLISYQIKKNRIFFIFQCFGSLFFVLNFFMLGAYTGCLLNFVNIFRACALVAGKRFRHPIAHIAVQLLYVAVTVLTFDGWLSLLVLAPQIVMTYIMWQGNGKHIRYTQLLFVSPIWLTHNVIVTSIGGIACEIFTITSTLISIFRFRRSGYDTSAK